MRKIEYIHLHGLFVELRQYLQKTGNDPPKAFAAYDEYGVAPAAIHRRKDRHHEALNHLRDGIQIMLEAGEETRSDSPATTQPVAANSLSQ